MLVSRALRIGDRHRPVLFERAAEDGEVADLDGHVADDDVAEKEEHVAFVVGFLATDDQ